MGGYVYCGGVSVLLFVQLLITIICMTETSVVVVHGSSVPARKKVAIEGVVYCLDCTLDSHSQVVPTKTPVAGAVLRLECNNTRKGWEHKFKTSKKGKFLLKTAKVSSWGTHTCKIFLVSSPHLNCSSTGNPYPEPDGIPSVIPYSLIPVTTPPLNSPPDYQFYTTDFPLFFYPHWSPCPM